MKLSKEKREKIKKEVEKIYFRKIWKKLVSEWIKLSEKFKNN
jgi:hypothetical protein